MCYNDCPHFNIWTEDCNKPKNIICPEEPVDCPHCGCAVYIYEKECIHCKGKLNGIS